MLEAFRGLGHLGFGGSREAVAFCLSRGLGSVLLSKVLFTSASGVILCCFVFSGRTEGGFRQMGFVVSKKYPLNPKTLNRRTLKP